MHRGYIKLYRRLLESPLWTAEPFTRAQAWVDLIGLANHKDGFIRKRGIRVNLKRGEVGWGTRELAERWRWSRGKVLRFLNELCSENEQKLVPQTDPQNRNVVNCYLITNYELYQGDGTTNDTTDGPQTGPQTGRKRYQNKNDKNDKNEKKRDIEVFVLPDWVPVENWNAFVEMRKKIGKPLTEKAQPLAIKKLTKLKDAGHNPTDVLDQSVFHDWQGLFPVKEEFYGNRKDDPGHVNVFHSTRTSGSGSGG